MPDSIRIVPLSPDHRERLLAFFDGAFVDNPKWSSCYCHCYYVDHGKVDWKARTATENRDATANLVACGGMYGFVAELNQSIVGWCNAGPRTAYPALNGEPDHHGDKDSTGVILCFLIEPAYRNQGVATSLLGEACAALKQKGLKIAEAYPRKATARGPEHYHGPLQMYLNAGFIIDSEDDDSICVRKLL